MQNSQATLGRDPNLGDADRIPANKQSRCLFIVQRCVFVFITQICFRLLHSRQKLPLATRAWVMATPTKEKGTAVKEARHSHNLNINVPIF